MRRRVLTAGFVVGLLMTAIAQPAAALDPIPGRPIPDEPPVTQLTDLASASLVLDLDADGTREVVAVAALDEVRGFAAVQAWWVDADGSVEPSNQVRLRRSATFDDRVAIGNGIRIDEDGMTGVRLGEPAHLFAVRRDGLEVALATGLGDNPELTRACCLTIWEVTTAGPGEIGLDLVAELHSWASQAIVADLNADGTDEILLFEPDSPEPGAHTTVLLSWDGSAYRATRSDVLSELEGLVLADAGESDGVLGDDVLLVDYGTDGEGRLSRLTMRNGALALEASQVTFAGGSVSSARVLSLPEGPVIMTADGSFLELLRWTRDAPIESILAQPSRDGTPLAVFGSGADTHVLVGPSFSDVSGLQVFSATTGQWITVGADTRAGVLAGAGQGQVPTWTYTGLIPGGFPGAPEAFVFSGMRFEPAATPTLGETFSVEPMALLPGRRIAGTAGPGAAWTALSGAQSAAFGQSARIALVANLGEAAPLELAATASILEPEVEGGALEPRMLGVAPDPERPDQLIVGSQAVDFEIEAPPGSRVWWSAPGTFEESTVGADGVARVRLLESAGDEVEEGDRLARRVWIVTPAGHTYQGSWVIRVYRQPPSLGIDDEAPFLDFAPVVEGETLPGSTMTVNGEPATVAADGTFSVPVDIGIVPTEVRIVVTDPVGNRTERLISWVWPLDYRQLPWVGITVFVLFTVAGLLYVYEPEVRPRRRTPQDEEATFEEIGG